MIKNKKAISFNIVSIFIILICLFVGIIGQTNAWFKSEQNNIEITVVVGSLNFKLYHDSITEENEIYTNNVNNVETEPSYIPLSGEIVPDKPVDLNLILANEEDSSSPDMYIKFNFKLYAQGLSQDTEIATTLLGFANPTTDTAGFVKDAEGYYHYAKQNGVSYTSVAFKGGTNTTLMTKFKVSLEEFLKLKGSETVKIDLVIETSTTAYLINT